MALFEYGINYKGDNNEVVVIDVQGYIDSTTSPDLSMIIDRHIAQGKSKFIVNLKEVDYISSIGWGVFISNLKELRENSGDLLLTNMSTNVHNIFDLMELSSIIKSFADVDKALTHFLGVRQQTVQKKRAVGSETTVQANKPSSPVEKPATVEKPAKPVQSAEDIARTASIKNRPKPSRAPVNRPGKRPPPVELIVENKASPSVEDLHYTKEHFLEKSVVRVVLDKPFYSVGQITKALRLPRYGSVKVRRRKIKQELIKLGLETREDRYEFALRNK